MDKPQDYALNVSTCPYKGLIPYGEDDSQIFFGREDWCTIITNNLLASHLTLLYGASGVGKSSVLLAGVANRLKNQARQSASAHRQPEWAVIICRDWRDDPLATLRERIMAAIEEFIGQPLAQQTACAKDLRSLLRECSQAIARVNEDGSRTPGKLLLIIDQFEEYFLYHPQENGTGTFAEEFPRAVNDAQLSLNVLISLREDSLAKLDRFKQQLPDLFSNRLQIDHLDRAAAIDAIRKPIEEFNRRLPPDSRKASVEPALIQDVLEQVKVGQIQTGDSEGRCDQPAQLNHADPGTLRVETPFLQLVMTRLWEEESQLEKPPRLRQETLLRLGGAGTIVREHLDRLMEGLPEASKRVASVIFDKLVTSGLTKIAYPVFELTDATKVDRPQDLVNRRELKELLDHLSSGSQRILRRLPPALDQPRAEERYEIFHDVLAKPIREWSRAYRETAERQQEREQHAQELLLERQERKRLRNSRTKWVTVAGFLLTTTGVLLLKFWDLRAQQQKLTIIESAQQFKGQQQDQIDALVQALQAAHKLKQLWKEKNPEIAIDIGANLRHILDNITEITKVDLLTPNDPSARLIRFNPDGTQVGIVFQNNAFEVRDLRGKRLSRKMDRVASFVFAKEADRFATVSKDGNIQVWSHGKAYPDLNFSTKGLKDFSPIRLRNRLHFSPDGQRLAVIDQEGDSPDQKKSILRVLDLSTRPAKYKTDRFGDTRNTDTPSLLLVRFSPAGDLLASTTEAGEIFLYNALTGRKLFSLTSPERALWISTLEFSTDGRSLAAATPNGVHLWQKDSVQGWRFTRIPAFNTSQLRFSPDGKLLATGSLDGWARIWDVHRRRNQKPLAAFLNQAPVQDVRFVPNHPDTPDGLSLNTVSTAGMLHQWRVPIPQDNEIQPRPLSAAAFNPGGDLLAEAGIGAVSLCLHPIPVGPVQLDSCARNLQLPLTSDPKTVKNQPRVVINQLAFNPQSTLVVGMPWRGRHFAWDIQKQGLLTQGNEPEPKTQSEQPNGPFSAISFHPDGERFAVVPRGGEKTPLWLCPARGNRPCTNLLLSMPGKKQDDEQDEARQNITSVQFLPGPGSRLLFSMSDGRICSGIMEESATRVDVDADTCTDGPKRQGSWWQLSVSPQGSTIGLAGFDGTLHLFQMKKGNRLEKLLKDPIKASAGPLQMVAFSDDDGGYLAIVALNGTASLWHKSGLQLASFSPHDDGRGSYMKAGFTSKGSQLLLLTKQGILEKKKVENLDMLLERGCRTLNSFLKNPATDSDIKNKLDFCKRYQPARDS